MKLFNLEHVSLMLFCLFSRLSIIVVEKVASSVSTGTFCESSFLSVSAEESFFLSSSLEESSELLE